MTKITIGLLVLAFTTSTAFAQDYLNCGLNIKDNKVDCPFFGSCHHETLKTSKSQLFLEVNEGQLVEGKISFKKVLVSPGTSKEKKNKITIFKDDMRVDSIKKDKKADLVSYDVADGIDYSVQKSGDTLIIGFKSTVYKLDITLQGDAKYNDYMLTSNNAVSIICERLNKSVYEEFKSKKEAIDLNNKQKAEAAASKQ